MLRQPRTPELFHAPPEFLCAGPGAKTVALPLGGQVSPALLRRFARLMAKQAAPVQLARMGYDRLYAFECLARAHACDDEALRGIALRLFDAFERIRA
jgi:hypothetical protein